MKKFLTLFFLTLTIFSARTLAQVCNADFTFIVNNQNVSFSPAQADSPAVHHSWSFGDGTTGSNVAPNHFYSTGGSYTVRHIVYRVSNTGTAQCVDTVTKIIQLANTNTCNLVANFSWQTSTSNNLNFYFTNTSAPVSSTDSIRWTFGDGTTAYTLNANHIYAAPGVYNVCLRVKKNTVASTPACVREICKQVTVSAPCNLVVNFESRPDSLTPRNILFNNTSSPVASGDTIRWTFGDGTTSSVLHPAHQYAQPGTYTVCLWIKKPTVAGTPACSRDICKTITVGDACNIAASFNTSVDPNHTNNVHFQNTTSATPIANASVKWTFGDGGTAFTWDADHLYNTPGTYQVCLRIQTSANCIKEVCKSMTVVVPCDRQSGFTTSVDPANARRLYFNNTTPGSTTGVTTSWTFGDGTNATGWNVVHEYANAGRYYVCQRVEFFPGCVKEKCDSITVNGNTNCQEISKWTSSQNANDCLLFKFEPTQKNTAWQYRWTFGDGTGSYDMSPQHKYGVAGNYTACLTVYKTLACASTTCGSIATGNCVNCDSVSVRYVYSRDAGNPNKISFTAVSNSTITQQTWTITKLPLTSTSVPVTLQQVNPVYTFGDTGYYRVCIRAYTTGNCVKEYCEVIHIGPSGTTSCTLQAYPNPAVQGVNVNLQLSAPEMIHAYIYNSLNILVKQKDQQGATGNNVVSFDVSTLVPGQYTIKLVYGNSTCYAQFQKL